MLKQQKHCYFLVTITPNYFWIAVMVEVVVVVAFSDLIIINMVTPTNRKWHARAFSHSFGTCIVSAATGRQDNRRCRRCRVINPYRGGLSRWRGSRMFSGGRAVIRRSRSYWHRKHSHEGPAPAVEMTVTEAETDWYCAGCLVAWLPETPWLQEPGWMTWAVVAAANAFGAERASLWWCMLARMVWRVRRRRRRRPRRPSEEKRDRWVPRDLRDTLKG